MEAKPTPGPWKVEQGTVQHQGWTVITAPGMRSNTPLAKISNVLGDQDAAADAALIAEAGTVFHETGMTPRQLVALVERLKLEARIHSGEARAANHSLNEIYQIASGAQGEKANWNGSEPVRLYAEQREEFIAGVKRVFALLGTSGDVHQINREARDLLQTHIVKLEAA